MTNIKTGENAGQDINAWNDSWKDLSPESEIRMWDFYGLRQWILTFAPRNGKIIEAGCGLGRYVFYLSKLGLDIEGSDFSETTIDFLNEWKKKYNFSCNFLKGDITNLPYQDNSLSGYISLGVIEHFIEGPHRPLQEAFRVLRPGGIAIISTPSVSFNIFARKMKKKLKNSIKKLICRPVEPEKFFQYWYRPKRLKKYVEDSGLHVSKYSGGDLLYAFCERGGFSGENLKENSFAYKFSHKFENSFVNTLGAQSITISVKRGKDMHCFLCGNRTVQENMLLNYTVPLCRNCERNEIADFYLKNKKPIYYSPYIMNPAVKPVTKKNCDFCDREYITDILFEDFGFSKNVCADCLKRPEVNIILSNRYSKPIWRKRK